MPAAPQVSLVEATLSDADLLTSYMRQLRADDPMPEYDFAHDAAVRAALEALIREPSLGRIWLIRAGETVVGYASLSFSHILEFAGRCAILDEFFIQSSHRRQGIARSALQWICESAAPMLGVHGLFLEVSPDNVAATALYRAAGFGSRPYNLMVRATPEARKKS